MFSIMLQLLRLHALSDCLRRRLGSVVRYVSDVMLPDGLFGPIIGFVIRLKYFS